jgi:Cu/Ag efflux protein CusF
MTYLGVGAICAKLIEHEGVEKAHVAGHLLHAPQLAFLLSIREFDHETRRCTLKHETL